MEQSSVKKAAVTPEFQQFPVRYGTRFFIAVLAG
jgi:hypothetical protein